MRNPPEQVQDFGALYDAQTDTDERGSRLLIFGDEGYARFRVPDVAAARALLQAVEPYREWVFEHDQEERAYRAASPEERERVLGIRDEWSVKA